MAVPEGYEFKEDHTGKTLERPELNRLMKLVREKKVGNVIIYAVDRLARKIGVADMLLDEFMENNVRLWIVQWGGYVKGTPEDRLRFNFEATFSDFERRKLWSAPCGARRTSFHRASIWAPAGHPTDIVRRDESERQYSLSARNKPESFSKYSPGMP